MSEQNNDILGQVFQIVENNFRSVLQDIAVFNNEVVQNHQILIEEVKIVLVVVNSLLME
jgi:hypothetical protein